MIELITCQKKIEKGYRLQHTAKWKEEFERKRLQTAYL